MLKDVKYWCPEVYRNLFIERVNDDKVRIAPCCQAVPSVENADTFDFVTSKYLTSIRNQFDQGVQSAACQRCWTDENINKKSRRQSAIEFFNIDNNDTAVILQGIDYNATWACNLTCIMCGPGLSSAWAKELKITPAQLKHFGKTFTKSNQILNQQDLSNIRKIHFNGGEPLINDDHTNLLSRLDQLGLLQDVVISYNTNGTIMPNKKTVELWAKAQLVKLFYSIDATLAGFEYIRYPALWRNVENNILSMKCDLPSNVMFGINAAVGCYNVFEIKDVVDWFNVHLLTNREGDKSNFCWQFVHQFDFKFLDESVIQVVCDHLSNVPELSGIVQYLLDHNSSPGCNIWIEKLNRLDQRRGTSWAASLKISNYIKGLNC